MFDALSTDVLLIGAFAAVIAGFLYLSVKFVRRDPPAGVPTKHAQEYSYDVPDQWDQETPLQWCEECGVFNEADYHFCAECINNLSAGAVMPPQTIRKLQNEMQEQQ